MFARVVVSLSRIALENHLLSSTSYLKEQVRTTFVLKRKFPALLHKKSFAPKKLKAKHFAYELICDTNTEKKPDIEVILTAFVDGLGNVGDTVSVRPRFGYNNLLLPGLAVYATPENALKYKSKNENLEQFRYSSSNALLMMKSLSRHTLSVIMNKDHPWTIQPWHIKVSFRKSGFVVPEHAIALPEQPIKGPDMNLENKEFYVTVTINQTETVNVRCMLHHWSTEVIERIPYVEKFWEQPMDPIHPQFNEALKQIPSRKNVHTSS